MVTIATWAFGGSYDADRNLKDHLAGLQEAARSGAQLVVFPETSLQGYPVLSDQRSRQRVLADAYETAEPLDGPRVATLIEAARDIGVHAIFGMTERGQNPGALFNATILVGPDGLGGVYRKVHVGITEQQIWHRGGEWPVFVTPLGRIGMLICYDQAWPESCRELTLAGAELLVMPTAWPLSLEPGKPESTESLLMDQYLLYGRARAAENSRWFISSNYTGDLGGMTFFGHSQVIDPEGRVIADTGDSPHSGFALADIDIRGGIEAACTHNLGDRFWRDRRPETYRRIAAPSQ